MKNTEKIVDDVVKREDSKTSLFAIFLIMTGGSMFGSGLVSFFITGIQTFAISVGAVFMIGGFLYSKLERIEKQLQILNLNTSNNEL